MSATVASGTLLLVTKPTRSGASKAGTEAANGTFKRVSATLYTNTHTRAWLTNNTATTWNCYSLSGTALYTTTAGITNDAWTLVGGSLPALKTVYGEYLRGSGLVILDELSSTNLDARLAAQTADLTTTSNGLRAVITATNAILAAANAANTANLTTVSNNYVRTNDTRAIVLTGSFRAATLAGNANGAAGVTNVGTAGQVTLVDGTNLVATTAITPTAVVLLTYVSRNGNSASPYYRTNEINSGVNFTIRTGVTGDTNKVNWFIVP